MAGLWDVIDKGMDIIAGEINNYRQNQSIKRDEAAQVVRNIESMPPKLLDNYYYGSHVSNIINENGIYKDNISPDSNAYIRDSYIFCNESWHQIFIFDYNDNLYNTTLLKEWDGNIYNKVVRFIGSKCDLVFINGAGTYADQCEAIDNGLELNEFQRDVGELEEKGLKNDSLSLVYVDKYVWDYFTALDSLRNLEWPKSIFQLANLMPRNMRIITLNVDEGAISINFANIKVLNGNSF